MCLDDYMTDELQVVVESRMMAEPPASRRRDVSNPGEGGAAFTVVGMHLWDTGSDIYGAFDMHETMDATFKAFLNKEEPDILGFQENGAQLNLGILSHIREL